MPETVFILGEGGTVFEMALPLSEAIEDRLVKGYLKRVKNAEGAPLTGKSELGKPAPYASKGEWVGWAVHKSALLGDPITADDAEALTKTDLIERYGVE